MNLGPIYFSMEIIHTISTLQPYINECKARQLQVGFVPTMGALHEGHLSLIKQSLKENDITVCSIFVNPTQFNNTSDLANYPRTIASDIQLLEKEGCTVVFIPSENEIYPSSSFKTLSIDLQDLDKNMEGKYRPGHFMGMVTVVKRLFEIVQPHKAYFGKKDYQQLKIIQFMVSYFKLPIQIVACETLREPNGLAMSSRNTRLSTEQRKNAEVIYRALLNAKQHFFTLSITQLKNQIAEEINSCKDFKVEYVEIANANSLKPIIDNEKTNAMAFVACFAGEVRLIDNIHLS
ncbi:pantoate--beta-alanine ligase [Flavobacteriales bacterium]|nr:Pantothenate synthetase [Flavobacteriales bacterium]GIK70729.1 MAG: pantothenate synthetase [Bacteroidota bacterium]CAG0993027.1 pantoate--beta-alanine ligase [Flavobacteriales bacterium]